MPFTPSKIFIGIAPEAVPGTAVAMTMTIPVSKHDFEDKPLWLDDPSIRGSMAALYGRYPGTNKSDFSFAGPMYPDVLVHLAENILGDRTTTGAADPYTHAISLNNSANGQPKTHTLTQYTGITDTVGARVYASAALSELEISYDAESKLVEYNCKGNAWGSAVAGAEPDAAPSSVPPFASWRGIIGIGGPASGGTLVTNVASASIEIKRKLDLFYALTNERQPYVIQRGELSCAGKIKFIAENEDPLVDMLAGTVQQLQLVLDNGTVGAGKRGLTINLTQAIYKSVKLDEGKTATMYDVTFDGIANATDAGTTGLLSPCEITIINGNAGTVY